MTRPVRALAVVIAVVLLVGLGAVVVRPLRDMRSDIHAQRSLLAQQLSTTRQQLGVAQRQLEVAQQTRDTARRTDARVARAVELATTLQQLLQGLAADVERGTSAAVQTRDLARRLLALARQLEALAASTERHAASLDHKTGPTVP